MAHSASSSSPQRLSIRWCIAAVAVIVAAGFGGYGMWRYDSEHHHPADPLSVGYHTLQLFILHSPHLEHPVNWQSHIGRWLAALVVFWAAIRGIAIVFRSELRWRWTWTWGDHVIICGLGRLGRQLLAEFQKRGTRVVVIESQHVLAADACPPGVVVLNGDACDASQLRRAGVTRARQLIAVCDDIQTNVAIVATAGEIVNQKANLGGRNRKLEGWLFIPDGHLRQLFKRVKLFPHTGSRFQVNVRGLDLSSLAARQVLNANPLDYTKVDGDSEKRIHFVIVGFGPMGQRLALQAAQVGHFANRHKLKITVLEQSESLRGERFLNRYPAIKEIVEFKQIDFSHESLDAAKQIMDAAQSTTTELTTIALCWSSQNDSATGENELFRSLEIDDANNLKLALGMHQIADDHAPGILLFQTRRCGFAALFGREKKTELSQSIVSVFGTVEETCSLDALMHESTDLVARVLHEDWYEGQIAGGRQQGDKPALWPWDQVSEMYKESNRHAADHIPVKLRALGYVPGKIISGIERVTQFDDAQIELLAEMEHSRWMAEHKLMGYTAAPGRRNDEAKTHPDLVGWDELGEDTKGYDRSQVEKIPEALERAGMGIYRNTKQMA